MIATCSRDKTHKIIHAGKFCTECGAPLTIKRCPKCGLSMTDTQKFCESCGTNVQNVTISVQVESCSQGAERR